MTEEDRKKVIGHALDHVAYKWARGLPVRHDRRDWTPEEIELYNKTFDEARASVPPPGYADDGTDLRDCGDK